MNPPFAITEELAGQTLAAIVRHLNAGMSWSKVKSTIETRHVKLSGAICMDPARRLKAGETVEVLTKPVPVIRGETAEGVTIRHLDEDVVVVEKVAGLNTVRHPAELEWKQKRRELAPTLQDVVQDAIAIRFHRKKHELPRLRIVHRLDKETSGLVVFARSVLAERELGRQFKDHTVIRKYLAIVDGHIESQKIQSWLVRDRGDGRRGSGPEGSGKFAATNVEVLEQMPKHTRVVCRLETGRTHQIRIHLSEAGNFVCGEPVYRKRGDVEVPDSSNAKRLALHAMELGFNHPKTAEALLWKMPPPRDLEELAEALRKR
jgi:23S rRNA pseudouridine1911/1915/1917 synthase